MRQGIECALREAESGSLNGLRRCLEGWRFVCRRVDAAAGVEAAPNDGAIQVVELRGHGPLPATTQRTAWSPSLALCHHDDVKALSLAASSGFDDVLIMPLDPVELVRRLQSLAAFAELRTEHRRRAELFAPYRDEARGAPAALIDNQTKSKVVLLGKADDHQVRVVSALPPASLTYLETPRQLPALLSGGAIDLALVTQPGLIVAALEAIDMASGEPPMLLTAHAGPPTALELPPQVEHLPLPAPWVLIRMRLALALRVGALRRWLRAPPLGDASGLLLDALTGLFNQGAFLDYLRVTGEERALIGLEPDCLDQLNRMAGYAAGSRALARLGQVLRHSVRSQDFAAHLGGGRLVVAVTASSRQQLEGLRCRLETTVAAGEPWHVLSAAEGLPARGAPAQRLARLFGDLRRMRPAA